MLEKFCDNDNQKRCFALIDSIIAEPLKEFQELMRQKFLNSTAKEGALTSE